MTDLADAPPHVRPLERYVQLETDHFCDCGYNLHGQVVTRDERLNFMVCRCPECGKWHPAGDGTSARRVWLNRIGLFALFVWIITAVVIVCTLLLAMGGMQGFHSSMLMVYVQALPDGTPVEFDPYLGQWINARTGAPIAPNPQTGVPNIQGRRALRTDWHRNDLEELAWANIASIMLATALGSFIALAAWHVRRRYYLWATLLPVVVAVFIYLILRADYTDTAFRRAVIPWLALCVVLQMFFVWLGTLIGRPVVRGLARVFVPPKPRQALAFLWHVDGKMPPAAHGSKAEPSF